MTALRDLRRVLDVTQAEMAARLGVRRQKYSDLERGRGLTYRILPRIAKLTGQTIDQVASEYSRIGGAR